jgi:hypothetical protein
LTFRHPWSTPVGLLPLVALASVGCDGCRDTPSVPFAIDGSGSAPASAAPSARPVGSFQEEASAPADPSKLELGGRAIDAPEGRTFGAVLIADGDGDGVDDAFAWAKEPGGGGELLFIAGKDHGETKATLHAEKARSSCTLAPRLRRLGRVTLAVDVDSTCTGDAGVKDAAKIVVVHLPEGGAHGALPEARLVVERKASPVGERLELAVAAEDRDHDGTEDLVVRAKLQGAPQPLPGGGKA